MTIKKIEKGYTLLGMLLILVIASTMVYMAIGYNQQRTISANIDKTAQQMQQILTAGLSYFIMHGRFPMAGEARSSADKMNCLKAQSSFSGCSHKYLPSNLTNNAWVQPYNVDSWARSNFYVYTEIKTASKELSTTYAKMIAAKLPLAHIANPGAILTPVADCSTASCLVVSSVNEPGHNLSNARSMNFAGLYHHGGCIPVPTCPVDASGRATTPEVFVTPVQVSGVFDRRNNSNVYPLSSFTAYATGGANESPAFCNHQSSAFPNRQPNQSCLAYINAASGMGAGMMTGGPYSYTLSKFWRACLDITTEKGNVNVNRGKTSPAPVDYWGNVATLAAFTRCAVADEPAGSNFTVYGD